MSIATTTGDDGTTGLFGGTRVSKSDRRIEATGAVDELNAALGTALAWLASAPGATRAAFAARLAATQRDCFAVGAELACATPDIAARTHATQLGAESLAALDAAIAQAEAELAPLTQFILPGGTPLAAALHVARTVCRRAERRVVALGEETASATAPAAQAAAPPADTPAADTPPAAAPPADAPAALAPLSETGAVASTLPVRPLVLRYLNRLSDALFLWARLANACAGIDDIPWTPGA